MNCCTVFFSFIPLPVYEKASLSFLGLSWVIVLLPVETGRAALLYEEDSDALSLRGCTDCQVQ